MVVVVDLLLLILLMLLLMMLYLTGCCIAVVGIVDAVATNVFIDITLILVSVAVKAAAIANHAVMIAGITAILQYGAYHC